MNQAAQVLDQIVFARIGLEPDTSRCLPLLLEYLRKFAVRPYRYQQRADFCQRFIGAVLIKQMQRGGFFQAVNSDSQSFDLRAIE